jgi:hypothetical protein
MDRYRRIQRQQGDLISLLLFFQSKESGLEMRLVLHSVMSLAYRRPGVDKPGEAQEELCLQNTVGALGKGKPVRQGGMECLHILGFILVSMGRCSAGFS